MTPVYKKLVLDVSKKIHDIIVAVQGDAKTRYLDITLMDGVSEIDITGCEVRIYGKKFDGTEFFNNGEITNAKLGRCQFELTAQALAVAGDLETNITIWKNNVEILSTPAFTIHVVKSLMSDHAIESSNEYGALVVLYQNLYEAYDLMTQMVTKIGTPEARAQQLSLNTMFQVWDWLIKYLEANSSAGDTDKIVDTQTRVKDIQTKATTNLSNTTNTNTLVTRMDAGSITGQKLFTTNGTFKVPFGVTSIFISACAGGGGGGKSNVTSSGGAGGNGGDCMIGRPFTVTPNQTLTITIGVGGNGNTNGTNTVISPLVTLIGGFGATDRSAPTSANTGGGFGGTSFSGTGYRALNDGAGASGGYLSDIVGAPFPGVRISLGEGSFGVGRNGGAGTYGGGGGGAHATDANSLGGGGGGSFGGGGAGAKPTVAGAHGVGGKGGAGIVIIEW